MKIELKKEDWILIKDLLACTNISDIGKIIKKHNLNLNVKQTDDALFRLFEEIFEALENEQDNV